MKIKTFLFLSLLSFSWVAVAQKFVNKTGQKAPDIVVNKWVNQLNSEINLPDSISISDLRGRTIVLDFWFTNCAPCVASIPHLNGLTRMYPEVVFLSITFENKEVIKKFLDKKMMHYPVGLDIDKKTIKAYDVSLYPETYVIDSSGIIRWQGSSFNLENEKIDEILGIQPGSRNLQVKTIEGKSLNQVFRINIEENNLEMGGSSMNSSAYKISIFNKNLKSILKDFFEVNHARIVNEDSILSNKNYNIEIEVDKNQTKKNEVVSILQSQLPRELNFRIIPITKDTTLHLIRLSDESKLKKYASKSKGQVAHWSKKNWKGEGVSFRGLKDLIENEYELPAEVEDKTYGLLHDYNLPLADFEEFKKTLLEKYGIEIVEKEMPITFYEVIGK